MLDQLVESKSDSQENKWRNGLLLVTLVIVLTSFVSGLGYSLFNQNLFVGGDGLELSTLVAPVPLPDEAPPEPEPEKQPEKQINADVRKELIANLNMTPPKPPDRISTDQLKARVLRDNTPVVKGDSDSDRFDASRPKPSQADLSNALGQTDAPVSAEPAPKAAPPPPPPPPSVPKRISKGVVNGSAVSLPKPAYPAAARAVNAKGSVNVAIVISKDGDVISASAVSGHPLLRAAAEGAARRARFRPTLLSGQPVEVSGVIVYNFQ
jgi:protein TonB